MFNQNSGSGHPRPIQAPAPSIIPTPLSSAFSSAAPAPVPVPVEPRNQSTAISSACLGCRSKHLKCDGTNPCNRCRLNDIPCQYIASRRGYKGPKRNTAQNPNKRHASDSPESNGGPESTSCPMLLGATGPTSAMAVATFDPALNLSSSPFAATPATSSVQGFSSPQQHVFTGAVVETSPRWPSQPVSDRCIDSFYFHFHPGHPAVLPKAQLLKAAQEKDLDHLLAAMKWAGSLYLDVGPQRATYYEEAMRLAYAPEAPRDGFLVQALIILIVGLDGDCDQAKAREILADAERIAIEIGLWTRSYAASNGDGNPVLEESWRRTWWDLFVVDGMIAGVHQATNFLLFDIVSDVALPCEEIDYMSGNIPRSNSLEDLDDAMFLDEDISFSSFAYRIASIRNLGRMMRLPPTSVFPDTGNVDKIESHLSNWRLHLPASKQDCLTKDLKVDEMMFQGFMINYACTIMLHQPLSQLDSSPARDVDACKPHQIVRSGDQFNGHTRHIIMAASGISKMVTYNAPITSHTHFFTCVLTLSSIVHLCKWALCYIHNDEDLRQQIRLNVGSLNKLSTVWGAAAKAGGQVRGVAKEIYRTKRAQENNATFWAGFTQEEIISSYASDESIMSEVNTLLQP